MSNTCTPPSPAARRGAVPALLLALALAGCAGESGDVTSGGPALVGAAASPGCSTVTYTPPGSDPQQGDLCVPAGARTRTAVVLVHGGGSVQGRRDQMVAWQTRLLADGLVTLNIDYLLVGPETPSPVFPRDVRNVKAAAQYLRARAAELGIDADAVLLLGTSAGARLGGVAFTTPDDPLFAGVGRWPGVSDRVNGFIGFYGSYAGALLSDVTGLTPEQYYGGGPDSPDPAVQERYAKAKPESNAAAASGPAILLHGSADQKSPVMQSVRFDQALRASGKDSTLAIFPGAGHSFDRERRAGRPLTADGREAARQIAAWIAARFR